MAEIEEYSIDNSTEYDDANYTMGSGEAAFDINELILFRRNVLGIGGYTTCCIGIIGNVLSLFVLGKRSRTSSLFCYLIGLAVADLLNLIITMIAMVEMWAPDVQGHIKMLTGYTAYVKPYSNFFEMMLQMCSIYMTVTFTIDRYIFICHPFKASKLCTASRARKVTVLIYVLVIVYNIPRWFDYKTQYVFDPMSNTTEALPSKTWLSRKPLYKHLVHDWLYIPIVLLMPLAVIVILNSFLIHAVILSSRQGKHIGAKDSQEKSTTIMLIAVIFMFLLCQIPALISNIIQSKTDEISQKNNWKFLYFNVVCKYLIILNSSVNIFFYCYFGQKFRQDLLNLICGVFCCGKSRDAEWPWYTDNRKGMDGGTMTRAARTEVDCLTPFTKENDISKQPV